MGDAGSVVAYRAFGDHRKGRATSLVRFRNLRDKRDCAREQRNAGEYERGKILSVYPVRNPVCPARSGSSLSSLFPVMTSWIAARLAFSRSARATNCACTSGATIHSDGFQSFSGVSHPPATSGETTRWT